MKWFHFEAHAFRSFAAVGTLAALTVTAACSSGGRRTPMGGGGDEGGSGGTSSPSTSAPVDVPTDASGAQLVPSSVRERCTTSRTGPPVLRRLSRTELQATVEDVFPEIAAEWRGVRLAMDPASRLGFSNDAAALLVGAQAARDLLRTAEDVASLVTSEGTLASVLPCTSSGGEACALEFIGQYGMRLFRRPLSESERTEYVALFNQVAAESSFAMGVKWTLVALMQSPHAVYRSELGVLEDGSRALSQHELATELSYMFGGSTPDGELLTLAEQGQLSDPDVRAQQARRLIRSPRGQEVVQEFFRAWLSYGSIVYAQRDAVGNFAESVAPHLIEETRRFVDHIVYEQEGDLHLLLQAPVTAVNGPLSNYYGFGDAQNNDWAVVDRPWGAGVLSQGSVLVSTAHERATSPTLRGLLVYHRLLCNDKILPPAIVPTLEESAGEWNTTRELFETAHLTKGQGCDNCHRLFDPPGFTFEHFDETGRYREQENGFPIDPSGYLLLADGTFFEVSSFDEWVERLDEVPQVADCVSGLMAAYMFSGGGGQKCLAEEQRTALAGRDIGIEEYLVRLTSAPHFTTRYQPSNE